MKDIQNINDISVIIRATNYEMMFCESEQYYQPNKFIEKLKLYTDKAIELQIKKYFLDSDVCPNKDFICKFYEMKPQTIIKDFKCEFQDHAKIYIKDTDRSNILEVTYFEYKIIDNKDFLIFEFEACIRRLELENPISDSIRNNISFYCYAMIVSILKTSKYLNNLKIMCIDDNYMFNENKRIFKANIKYYK